MSFPDILYYFLNFTSLTNYFRNPLTPELIANFNTVNTEQKYYTFAASVTPKVILNRGITIEMASRDEIRQIMEGIFGAGGGNLTAALTAIQTAAAGTTTAVNNLTTANQNRTGTKIVEVPTFHGRDDEDPYEWCQIFEQAHAANGWPDGRKVALAAGHLRDAARDWYELDRGNINQYHTNGQNDNFDDRLINYFFTLLERINGPLNCKTSSKQKGRV